MLYDALASPATAGALVALIVVLVLTGQLVTRRTHKDALAERDKRITDQTAEYDKRIRDLTTERDTWRDAWIHTRDTNRVQTEQVGALLELGHTATHVLAELPGAVEAAKEKSPDAVA